jgi:N6-adenosine-specific RNA methylase IME4
VQYHPLANIFPLIDGEAFDALKADIKAKGLREPIALYQKQILDGRNRWRACKAVRVRPKFETYRGNDPLGYVVSLNVKRRHLDESQRAMAGARVATLPWGVRGDRQEASIDASTTQRRAAEMMNVSRISVQRARLVLEKGDKDIIAAVEAGDLSVDAAAEAIKLEIEERREIAKLARLKSGQGRKLVRKVIKRSKRRKVEEALAEQIAALPDKKYGVILADPEWKFETWSDDGQNKNAALHYAVSDLSDIKARDVPAIAAKDCVLFLWATVPMLPQALEVMAAWDFEYKTHFAWVKDRTGTGYWNKNQHELLLLGTKGNIPSPADGTQWSSVIHAPRGRHSEKPEKALELIEAYFPNLPKIELNRRGPPRPGWDAWGAEAEHA